MAMQSAQFVAKHIAQLRPMQGAYSHRVQKRPNRVARHQRFMQLMKEVGGPAKLAELLQSSDTHLIAISKGRRNLGDALAAKIERVTGKPGGWLDEVINLEITPGRSRGAAASVTLTVGPTAAETVAHLANYIRAMPPGNRVALGRQLELFAQADDSAQVKAEIIALLTGAVDVEKNIGVDKHGLRYFKLKPKVSPEQDQESPAQPGEDRVQS